MAKLEEEFSELKEQLVFLLAIRSLIALSECSLTD